MPKANGHYATVIEHEGLLYLSGQLPFERGTKNMPQGIEAQTKLVLGNIEFILKEAGSSKSQILQMRLYIPNVSLWDQVNTIYAEFFGEHKPARTVVPTRELHFGALIEVETLAFVK